MDQVFRLESLFPEGHKNRANRLPFFALVNLGVVESLANGSIGAAQAVKNFYIADNCLFVRRPSAGARAAGPFARLWSNANSFCASSGLY